MRDAQGAAERAARVASRRLAAKLAGLSDTAKAVRSTGFRVPTLDEDPGLDFPTNDWMLEDGRRRYRNAAGSVFELVPNGAGVFGVLSLASDAAADAAGTQAYRHASTDEWRVKRPDGTWAAYASTTSTSTGGGGGGNAGGSTSTQPKPADPRPTKFREEYGATWGRSFCPTHGVEVTPDLTYGDSTWSTNHGFRHVMIGLNDSQIRADLAGATIKRVEIKAHNAHAGPNSGVDLHWMAHNSGAPPDEFSAVRRNLWIRHWPKVGWGAPRPYWRVAPLWIGNALRDGTIRGLGIWQPAATDNHYGAITWASVSVRITAVK